MDKEKIKSILYKLGQLFEKCFKFLWDIFTLCWLVGFGTFGVSCLSLCTTVVGWMNDSGFTAEHPDIGLLMVLLIMGGTIMVSLPLMYLSLYWRITDLSRKR